MKIGIVADIHEDVEGLRRALDRLTAARMDRLVVLGDLVTMGKRIQETAALLEEAGAVGVWGNHELGLYVEGSDVLARRYPRRAMDYMKTLQPRLELDGCLFTHGLPCWDPTDPAIYYLGDRPETVAGREAALAASPCRRTFVGHFHRWLIATAQGLLSWKGEEALDLAPDQRYLIVVAAVCDGWCALFDTQADRLLPIRCQTVAQPEA